MMAYLSLGQLRGNEVHAGLDSPAVAKNRINATLKKKRRNPPLLILPLIQIISIILVYPCVHHCMRESGEKKSDMFWKHLVVTIPLDLQPHPTLSLEDILADMILT